MSMDFSQLEFDGSIISEFKVVPSKKLVLALLRRIQKEDGRNVQIESDLQFNRVRHFKINIEAEPWLQVISHAALLESDYLTGYAVGSEEPLTSDDTELVHFQIVCGRGKIDIIGESFTVSLTNEIPYAECP